MGFARMSNNARWIGNEKHDGQSWQARPSRKEKEHALSATILRPAGAPSKPPPRPHNPDVCGLAFDSDCDACRVARQRDDRDFYERDADAKARARRGDIARRLADATGITLDELADALLPKLAEGMAEVAGAVMDERGAA